MVLQQMKDMLSPLGIYSLEEGTLVNAELTVYANAFQKLHQNLSVLLREIFLETAETYGVDMAEDMFGRPNRELSLAARKALLQNYFSMNADDFTYDKITEQLALFGITNPISEDCASESVSVSGLDSVTDLVTLSEYFRIAEDVFPAHLFPDVGIVGLTWNEFDGLNYSFGTWDRMGLRFDLFE